ncbi:transmembrane and coiled-coil domain-containing protein 5B-like isoform 3-T5 [Thomomys bottae]
MEQILSDKEDTLRGLELEIAKLDKKNKILARNLGELQKKDSKRFKNAVLCKGALKQSVVELKVRLQKSTESCTQQEKEMVKLESDYQSMFQLCEDQTHYIKKYQEILRQMEKERGVLLLEKEMSKAQNNSSQIVKPGSILVETIQSNMERAIIKKQQKIFWCRNACCYGRPEKGHHYWDKSDNHRKSCLTPRKFPYLNLQLFQMDIYSVGEHRSQEGWAQFLTTTSLFLGLTGPFTFCRPVPFS